MSTTCGPIVPPSTGSSTDFPVELSVNVIVPVTILFPSIDPPLSLCPQAVAGFDRKIGFSHAIGKPALARQRRLGSVSDPTAALLWPEYLHHPEDTGRGRRPGERSAQRLGHSAEPDSLAVSEFTDLLFERAGFPNSVPERVQQLC